MEIVVYSGNKNKIDEIKSIFGDICIKSIYEYGVNLSIDEDMDSFLDNAIKKAYSCSKLLGGKICIADDSGIEIDYLDGRPGVNTKRWLSGSDIDRNKKIIELLDGVSREHRGISFICAIAISDGINTVYSVGKLRGYVASSMRGNNGFGFDSIFELSNGVTLAELSSEEKNSISARKIALDEIKSKFYDTFVGDVIDGK